MRNWLVNSKAAFITWIRKRVTLEGVIRLVADIILINVAILASLAARLLYIVAYGKPQAGIDYRLTLWSYINVYSHSAWLLTIICVSIFTISGFYTYGRYYRGRYKVLIVAQAVSIAYLVFGLLTYLSQGLLFGFLKGFLNFPRGALILAWFLTTLFLVIARAWAYLWANITRVERRMRSAIEEPKIRHVLVIGGAGYIGSALLPMLLEKGYQVRVLDLLIYGTEPISTWLNDPNLEVLQADFRQIDKVVEAMQDIDAVVHLGGIVGDPACALDEELTIEINLMATRMIAEVAKGSKVRRFIFASTCSVYGASNQMLDERSELNPVSLYARSKIASEKVLLKMADDRFAPIILRFSTIYGLSGRTRFDLVINLLTAKALVEHEITIFGGNQWRPFLHVDDAARAIMLVLETPLGLVRHQVFNVGVNEQNYTIDQIGNTILKYVPEAKLVITSDNSDQRNYWVNFNKFHNTTGFFPLWTVEEGVKQVLDAIRSGKVEDYKDSKYSNVKYLTEEGIYRLAKRVNGWAYQLLHQTASETTVIFDL